MEQRLISAEDIGFTMALSCAVASADHDRPFRKVILADTAVVDQAVERFLYFL
jgi:hypothetical protein